MYVVYAVFGSYRSAATNLLRRYGTTARTGRLRIDDQFADVCRLDFEECSNDLANALRVAIDTWDFASHCIERVIDTDCPLVQAMLDTPDPGTPSLSWCVRAFKRRYARWDTPPAARGACGVASDMFVRFCRTKGLSGYDESTVTTLTCYFGDKRSETPDSPRGCHAVARVGRFRVDWTHRQYDAAAPYPLIWITPDKNEVFRK